MDVLIDVTGEDKLKGADPSQPPVWEWPLHYGYTKQDSAKAWAAVHANPTFWQELEPLAGVTEFNEADGLFYPDVDIYFITKRDSPTAKEQSDLWLEAHLDLMVPTVLVTGEKGLACKLLNLEAYIDDKVENAQAVLRDAPQTRMYLLDQPWNRHVLDVGWTRVFSVNEMLVMENLAHASHSPLLGITCEG